MFELRFGAMALFASSGLFLSAPAVPGSCGPGGSGSRGTSRSRGRGGSSSAPRCGDGKADHGDPYYEYCDGADLGDYRLCHDYSDTFSGGRLSCKSDCRYDFSGCTEACGNGKLDALEEQCDGTVF